MKLTKREIDQKLRTLPSSGQRFYWDDELKGFGIRVTPSGISYVARGTVRGTSRRPRVTLGKHGPLTPEMARAEAKKALGDMERGIDRVRAQRSERLEAVSLEEAYEEYVRTIFLKESTRRDYQRAMRVGFSNWRKKPLVSISSDMIRERFEDLAPASPAQANQMFRFLRSLFRWAMWRYGKNGTPLLPSNPCAVLTGMKRWVRLKVRKTHIAPPQFRSFMDALWPTPNDSDQRRAVKDLCALLILTGLREQEGCKLLWANFDEQQRTITVLDTKNGKDHTLPIGPWLAARLKARRALTADSPFVFPAKNKHGHLKHHRKDRMAVSSTSGVKFTFHDLRRTFTNVVDHYLERSFSKYTIKALLNHSQKGDVTAGYIDHPVESLREPMEMVENFVLRAGGVVPTAEVVSLAKAA